MQYEEDLLAAGVASYIVLLGAHARGLGGYWRTPRCCAARTRRAAVGVGQNEHVLGLLHLGRPRQEKEPPDRLPPGVRNVSVVIPRSDAPCSGGS